MQTLPNGLTVFNATPHQITFWSEGWDAPISVPTDEVINANPVETPHGCLQPQQSPDWGNVWLVRTEFVGDDAGREVIARAKAAGAEIIVGSIVAAQAYPGDVVAMIPAPGFERVAAPLPKDVIEALESAAHGSMDTALLDVLNKYKNLPTKRMSPHKFTVFQPPVPDGIYAIENGKAKKIDHFAWGYEGVEKAELRYVGNDEWYGVILSPLWMMR